MFRVFYSWISDRGGQNRQPIYHALVDALRRICSQDGVNIPKEERVVIQCGSFGGSTDISRFIFDQLPACHAHVVDLTFINHPDEPKTRLTPNPNNMLELGLALGRLGVSRCVPVFNTEHGDVRLLPFDIRNLDVVAYNGSAANARPTLANGLAEKLGPPARQYVQLREGLAEGVRSCLEQPLPYFEKFLAAHAGDPGLVEASVALFRPSSTGLPVREVMQDLLRGFSQRALSQQASSETAGGYTWGEVFTVLLRRLQADCRRLCHRYRDLADAAFFKSVQDLGLEAEHLERLFDRVSDRLADRLLDKLIVEETLAFLTLLLGVNRSLPCSAQAVVLTGLTELTPADVEVRVLEPAVSVEAPQIDR